MSTRAVTVDSTFWNPEIKTTFYHYSAKHSFKKDWYDFSKLVKTAAAHVQWTCLNFKPLQILHSLFVTLPIEDNGDRTRFTGWQLCSFQKAFIRHTAKWCFSSLSGKRKQYILIDNAIIAFHFITVKDYVVPRRSRTFNLPISASDALVLSCRRLLVHGDTFPADCLKRSTPIRQPIVYVQK